jgi:S1-C subfamily serine protease
MKTNGHAPMKRSSSQEHTGFEMGVGADSTGIITNEHHVVGGAQHKCTRLMDGRGVQAKIRGTNPHSDFAAISTGAYKLSRTIYHTPLITIESAGT